MSQNQSPRRFWVNPIEIGIFCTMSLILAHSVYDLLYNFNGLHPTALSPMSSSPVSEGRNPNSMRVSLATVNMTCDTAATVQVQASKVRLVGELCGQEAAPKTEQKPYISKIVIKNNANQFLATVFPDSANGKFSTDYIPLETGNNDVHVEFLYSNSKAYSRDLKLSH